MDDKTLLGFKALTTFVIELSSMFGEKHRPLKLYAHLLGKTTLAHDKAIHKHTNACVDFCIKNREAIYNKNTAAFVTNTITYSTKAYIDIKKIISIADKDTKDVIWAHLLTISAILDTEGRAKQILKDLPKKGGGRLDLSSLLGPLMTTIASNTGNSTDPNAMLSNLMSGGGLESIMALVSNLGQDGGQIDTGSLINSLSTTLQTLNKSSGSDPIFDSISKQLQSVSEGGEADTEGIKSIATSLLSNLGVNKDTSEQFFSQVMASVSTPKTSEPEPTTQETSQSVEVQPVTVIDTKKQED